MKNFIIKGVRLDRSWAPSALRCARCGKRVESCKCVCPGCGGAVWRNEGGEWVHHHCWGAR